MIIGTIGPLAPSGAAGEEVKFFYRGSFTYLGPAENTELGTPDDVIESVNVGLPYPNTGDNDPHTYPRPGFPISIALFDNEGNKEAEWFQNGLLAENVMLRENISLTSPREGLPEVHLILGPFNITEAGPKYNLRSTNLYPGETLVFTEWYEIGEEKADKVTIRDTADENRSAYITYKPSENIRDVLTSELHKDYIGNRIEYWTGVGETYSGHWIFLSKT